MSAEFAGFELCALRTCNREREAQLHNTSAARGQALAATRFSAFLCFSLINSCWRRLFAHSRRVIGRNV